MANMDMVGRAHRCIPVAVRPTVAEQKSGGSYKYRDPEKRRAYMRELMRRKRSG